LNEPTEITKDNAERVPMELADAEMPVEDMNRLKTELLTYLIWAQGGETDIDLAEVQAIYRSHNLEMAALGKPSKKRIGLYTLEREEPRELDHDVNEETDADENEY
jgi:hypothetical protein